MTATTGRPLATDYGRDVRDFVGTHVASRIDEWERDRQPAPGMLEALAAAGLLAPCSHVAPDGLAHRLALAEALGAKGALGAALAVASQLGTPLGVLELAPRAASDARWRRLAEEARAGAVAGAAHVSEPAYDGRLLVPAPICLTRADDALELRGECTDVLNGPVAQFAVVTARVAAGLPGAGWALVLLPLDAPGVHVQRRATLGLHTASMGRILLEDCKVSPDHLLATMPEDCALVRELLAEDRLPASAALLAVGRLLFDDTVAHVKTRAHAAGTLADLQTVRHRLASHGAPQR